MLSSNYFLNLTVGRLGQLLWHSARNSITRMFWIIGIQVFLQIVKWVLQSMKSFSELGGIFKISWNFIWIGRSVLNFCFLYTGVRVSNNFWSTILVWYMQQTWMFFGIHIWIFLKNNWTWLRNWNHILHSGENTYSTRYNELLIKEYRCKINFNV